MKIIIVMLIALPLLSRGQGNLVPNGGFEFHSTYPSNDTRFISLAFPWVSSGPICSPDYFNSDCPPLIFPPDTIPYCGVPSNNRGYQYARSGTAYAGFFAFSANTPNGREFVQIELTNAIVAGVRYEISFHVSLADPAQYAVRTMGAFFSETPVQRVNYSINGLGIEPQVVNQSQWPLSDKEGWTEVKDTFNSRYGGERYLLIGNFSLDSESDTLRLETGELNWDHSYYYIDDVSVVAIDSIPSGVNETEAFGLSVYPNPAQEFITISSGKGLSGLRLLDLSGRSLRVQPVASDRYTLPLQGIGPGIYMLEATDRTGRVAVQKVVVQ